MLDAIINYMAYGSLLFAAIAAYLQINKLWQRKHLPDVAASVSVSGILVEAIPLTFFGIYFLNKGELVGIIDSTIWLISVVLYVMIGAGFWVPGRRSKGLWRLAIASIKNEGAEVTLLARQIMHPGSSAQLIHVLTSMAVVDGELDTRERQLIEPFADKWGLDLDWDHIAQSVSSSTTTRLLDARDSVVKYLDTSPPATQARHLQDVLKLLVEADDDCSEEEVLALAEITGMLQAYGTDSADSGETASVFRVVIAPQDKAQDEAIARLLKTTEVEEHAGGRGYAVDQYFSREYAELICGQYRAMGFFTVVIAR